jgi:FtsZ-binding cell division protein ZapB
LTVSQVPHQEDEAVALPKRQDDTLEVAVLSGSTRSGSVYEDEPIEYTSSRRRNEEDRISLFWRLFGGAMISVAALVGVTLYNGLQMSISELRTETARLNEAKAEAAKKDDLANLRVMVNGHDLLKVELESLKEKQKAMAVEHKSLKDDTGKVRQDVDKNHAADQERKERRDAQYKAYEETIKEMAKSITELREKIARLEGATTPMKPMGETARKQN